MAGLEEGMLLGEAPLLFEPLQRLEHQGALFHGIDARGHPLAARTHELGTDSGVGSNTAHCHNQEYQPRAGRRNGQRLGIRRRLRDHRCVCPIAAPDRGAGPYLVVHRFFPGNTLQDQVAFQAHAGLNQGPGSRILGDKPPLHVARAAAIDLAVLDRPAVGIAPFPFGSIPGWHGIDMAVEDQRSPAALALEDPHTIRPAGLLFPEGQPDSRSRKWRARASLQRPSPPRISSWLMPGYFKVMLGMRTISLSTPTTSSREPSILSNTACLGSRDVDSPNLTDAGPEPMRMARPPRTHGRVVRIFRVGQVQRRRSGSVIRIADRARDGTPPNVGFPWAWGPRSRRWASHRAACGSGSGWVGSSGWALHLPG